MSTSETFDDGGPAFPQGHLDGPHVDPSGMSLLDWFAGKALQGIVANPEYSGLTDEEFAEGAYEQALLMLTVRERLNAKRGTL